MAATQLPAIFKSGALPAHLVAANEAANIVPRMSTNALTFEGKVWAISLDGKKTKLMKADEDGEQQPVQIFTGVILDYTKNRGRMYYAGKYDPKKPAIPDCWSEDGVKPLDAVPHKQATTCAACPMSKKGSGSSDDGRMTTACSQFRKIAIIPTAGLMEQRFPPLRLTLKITSDYDKDGADKHPGWHGFQQYLDLLVSNNVRHTALLPVKIKFDDMVAYPKLLFSPGKDWLTPDQWGLVEPLAVSDEVKALLAATFSPPETTGSKPLPEDNGEETEVAPAPMPAQARVVPATGTATRARPAAHAEQADDEEEVVAVEEPEEDPEAAAAAARAATAARNAEKAAAKVAAAAAKATKPAPIEEVEDDAQTPIPATGKAPGKPGKATAPVSAKSNGAGKGAPTSAPVAAPREVAEMLANWDE